ncbi:hypothetical protein ACP70R_006242 [Stipagrostis hirtigluma subsp. patula]
MGPRRRRAAAAAAAVADEDDDLGCSFLHELSREEQLRLRNRHLEHKREEKRYLDRYNVPPPPPWWTEEERDAWLIDQVNDALQHYNARHPGGDFDLVKPLMGARVGFRRHVWFHVNFWARSRSGNPAAAGTGKIKRFFAELHYEKGRHQTVAIVERVNIIEEPFSRYKSTICAFCPRSFDILHPKDGKYLTGTKNLRSRDELLRWCQQIPVEMPFTCPLTRRTRYQELRRPGLVRCILNWALWPFQFLWARSPLNHRKGFC